MTDQTQKQASGEDDDRMKKELKKLRSQNKEVFNMGVSGAFFNRVHWLLAIFLAKFSDNTFQRKQEKNEKK